MKIKITVKNIMRTLSILCFIFCFCPSFLVSCGGQNVDVNVMTAVQGTTFNGSQVAEPQPAMLLCYVIPLLLLVFLSVRKWADSRVAGLTVFFAGVDAVFWTVFRTSAKQIAEQLYCTFSVTAWYIFNMASLVAIIVLSVLVLMGKAGLETSLDGERLRLSLKDEGVSDAAVSETHDTQDVRRNENEQKEEVDGTEQAVPADAEAGGLQEEDRL